MRTKTLLLTAALVAATAASALAQVYSVNAVGYVNKTLPAGFSILANPLNGTNNSLNTILPLPNEADGTVIYRFANGTFKEPIQFYADFGWFTVDTDPDAMVIPPGEGFFLGTAPGATSLTLTFVGEVPQGHLVNPIPGGLSMSLRSSAVPQSLPLGDTGNFGTNTLRFPAADGDVIYLWSLTGQTYREAFQYYDGYGWFSAGGLPEEDKVGPSPAVGEGFWVQKPGAAADWTRDFSVN